MNMRFRLTRATRHRRLPRPGDGEDRCAGDEEGAADRAAPGAAHRPHHPRRHQGPRPERPHEGLRRRVAGGDSGALGGEAAEACDARRRSCTESSTVAYAMYGANVRAVTSRRTVVDVSARDRLRRPIANTRSEIAETRLASGSACGQCCHRCIGELRR